MPRLNHLALVAALLAAAAAAPAPALASEQELVGRDYIGFDYTPAPSLPLASTGDRAAPSAFDWDPEIVNFDADEYAVGYVFLEEILDPIALIDPGPGPDPALVASSIAAPAATAIGATAAGTTSQQPGCNCPCG